MEKTLYDFSAMSNSGEEIVFSQFQGRAVLIVNTASKCGFTGQYAGLEDLYRTYGPKGLVVIGFPCDQFAHQEPGSDADIAQFCSLNYGVTFPIMQKIEVNGRGAHPLYAWLKKRAPGTMGSSVKWNFTKFLVSGDGSTVARFAPTVEPKDLRKDIEQVLG